MKSKRREAAIVAALQSLRVEMLALRACITNEIWDLRAIAQHIVAHGIAIEHALECAEVMEPGELESLPVCCVHLADQRIEQWRSDAREE